jgi:LytS/YehU family sensor histidine kinase
MIIKLSDLLRTALDSDSADLISLQDELKFVREYLDLEKMRFGRPPPDRMAGCSRDQMRCWYRR